MSNKEEAIIQLDYWIKHWEEQLRQEPVPFPKEMSVVNLLAAAKQWRERILELSTQIVHHGSVV